MPSFELMLDLSFFPNPNRKSPFFSIDGTLNRQSVTQITVRALIEGSGEANAWLDRDDLTAPGYFNPAPFRSIQCFHAYSSKHPLSVFLL
jgi:hypothetical protein